MDKFERCEATNSSVLSGHSVHNLHMRLQMNRAYKKSTYHDLKKKLSGHFQKQNRQFTKFGWKILRIWRTLGLNINIPEKNK